MSNEITVRAAVSIRNGNLNYSPYGATQFQAGMTGTRGPVPGYLRVSYFGTNVDLSELENPGGWCEIVNNEPITLLDGVTPGSNIDWGIFDSTRGVFYPMGQLLPGEKAVVRLHPFLGAEQSGSGGGSGYDVPVGAVLQLRAESTIGADGYVGAFDA